MEPSSSSSSSRHAESNGDNNNDNGDIGQTNESDEGAIKSMIHDLMKSNYENLLSADRHLLKGSERTYQKRASELAE